MSVYPLVLSFVVCLITIPLVRKFSFRYGLVAYPRKDRWNKSPTPTLGGVSIFFGFGLSIAISSYIYKDLSIFSEHWNILVSVVLIFALGLYDDLRQLSPPIKLVGQILAATVVISYGDMINFFPWPIANIILTFFWLVGITNAINLLDNMDGLAGGVSLIASAVLSYFFWRSGNSQLLVMSLSLVGAIFGFLIFNFPPAKIFMGDSGSLFLGFLLASLAVARRTQASNVFAIIMVPTMIFLLPILDTALVTITRLLRGQSPTQGGTDHTSHRLIAFGLTEKQAVIILYAVAIISGVAAAALEALDYELSLLLIPAFLVIMSLMVAYLARLKVVTTKQDSLPSISRIISDLTYKRRLFEIILDLLLIGISYYLAYWTRFGLDMTDLSMSLFIRSWPIALLSAYISFYFFGVYRGVWRYIGFSDLLRFAQASLGSVILTILIIKVLYSAQPYTYDVFLLYAVFLFLGLAASRSSFRILDQIYDLQKIKTKKQNVLVIGAEDAGEFALRWILRNVELGYSPVGFLDNDPLKKGRIIHGVSVLGELDELDKIIIEKDVDGVIVSNGVEVEINNRDILDICRKRGIWIRVMRLEFELLSN